MKLIEIEDGDTVKFVSNQTTITCRINGIDTPETFETQKLYETSQHCGVSIADVQNAGEIAKAEAELLLQAGNTYMVAIVDTDKYSRNVCKVNVYNKDFGELMVQSGHAGPLEILCQSDRI